MQNLEFCNIKRFITTSLTRFTWIIETQSDDLLTVTYNDETGAGITKSEKAKIKDAQGERYKLPDTLSLLSNFFGTSVTSWHTGVKPGDPFGGLCIYIGYAE